MYHAQLGRFASRDPVGYRGQNVLEYVGGTPTRFTDPDGLWKSGEHERQTEAVFALFQGLFKKRPKCARIVLGILMRSNVGQDAGSLPGGNSMDPGEQFDRHYCMKVGQTKAEADAAYLKYTSGEMSTFFRELSARPITAGNCQRSLEALGRVTHSWQDYYAHAVRLGTPLLPVWGPGGVPRGQRGNPDNPGSGVKPPTFTWLFGGEHGSTEPATRDDRWSRINDSIVFVARKWNPLIPLWYANCKCWCASMKYLDPVAETSLLMLL